MISKKVDLALDSELLESDIQYWVKWDYRMHPHLLVLGNSGSGKTYFLRLLLGRIALNSGKIWLCDFKNDDFRALQGNGVRAWGYTDVMTGFEDFYTVFQNRLNGDPSRDFCLLLIDEYVSWLASMEKKESEDIKKRMATLLFMARSLNLHIILGCQRGMAENFTYGSRDCLNTVFMGAPSRESIHSFCSSEEAALMKPYGRGAGYTVFDGKPPRGITVPAVRDMEKLNRTIQTALMR